MEDGRRMFDEFDFKKRPRCSNFSIQERNILIHIIEKYHDVIESKKLDRQSLLERESIWDVIADDFNEVLMKEPRRTPKQLRICYENLKKKLRKEKCKEEEGKQTKVKDDPSLLLRSQGILTSDDSDSSANIHGGDSSCQDDTSLRFLPQDAYPVTVYQNMETDDSKSASLIRLQEDLLHKQIQSVNLDLEMKTKKYQLELLVEEAKLEYYQRKCELLTNMKPRPPDDKL